MGQISKSEKNKILAIVERISAAERATGYFVHRGEEWEKATRNKYKAWKELEIILKQLSEAGKEK